MTTAEEILEFQQLVRMVPIAESSRATPSNLVRATRATDATAPDFVKKYVNFGASVRAAQIPGAGGQGAGADAAPLSRDLRGHSAHCATPVLRHRILLNFHAESDKLTQDDILKQAARGEAAPRE